MKGNRGAWNRKWKLLQDAGFRVDTSFSYYHGIGSLPLALLFLLSSLYCHWFMMTKDWAQGVGGLVLEGP